MSPSDSYVTLVALKFSHVCTSTSCNDGVADSRLIFQQVVEAQPMIGPQESIKVLAPEYSSDDQVYQQKIEVCCDICRH